MLNLEKILNELLEVQKEQLQVAKESLEVQKEIKEFLTLQSTFSLKLEKNIYLDNLSK